jgi:serine/threonine-protein kinase
MYQTELSSSRYRVLKLIGQGQFGRVFCAVEEATGDLVALKELDYQRFPTNKFLRELRFLLSLDHPNIVNCHTIEHTKTGRYLVMDYCEGGSLRNLIDAKKKLSLEQGLKLMVDVLSGLDCAHSRNIVHCDLKPENILLSPDVAGWQAKISDFGIAKVKEEANRDSLGGTGSPAYMAPERFYGQFSPASDLYAVGIMLFEIAVGHRPFSGLPSELMSSHLTKTIKIPHTVPFLLRSTITTALQKLPQKRFASAAEMLKSLALAATVEKISKDENNYNRKVEFNS